MADAAEASIASATELLAAGRRHLAVGDHNAAAEALAKACELLAKEHGDTADECAEAYLWYGKALLGLAREESGVLGDGVPGAGNADEEDDDENEDEEEAADEEHNGEQDLGAEAKAGSSGAEGGEPADSAEGGVKKIEAESTTKEDEPSSSASSDKPGPSNGEALDESVCDLENEDEVDNLQLAWEMLELARGILQRRGGGGALAEALLALGEVALESETYDKAVSDMMSCLEIQKELYPSDDRRIAETHYQIGLANSLASNFEEAVTHLKNAANILETRMQRLEGAEGGEAEARELRALLPEVRERIRDLADHRAETMRCVRETLSRAGEGEGGAAPAPSAAPAGDISHLVRRKRRASGDAPPAPAAPPKKPHC